MATIKDIAKNLGISPSTVSKGLNGASDISESLRAKVLETAVALGYRKPGMRSKSDRRIAIFVENMEYKEPSQFGYDILLGFRQIAFKENYSVDIIEPDKDFQLKHKYDTFLMEHGYLGGFLAGFALDDPWMKEMSNVTMPAVLLDNYVTANPHVGYIGTDSYEGIDMAIVHLIHLGHEKIAFLNGSKDSMISDQRMSAYLESMNSHNLHIDPNMAIYSYFVAEAAKYHVEHLIKLGATAIICGNDLIAKGVIATVKEYGFSVPEDISVIGFDDIPLASKLDPPLTTIRQNRSELGKSAYFTLKAIINNIPMSKSMLRPSLVIRESTAEAKPRMVRAHENDKDSVLSINPSLYANVVKNKLIKDSTL
jgi:LacI family transcriptional regulator